jgi:triosephosphate isomerase
MRKTIVAGNWKMNNDLNETRSLIDELLAGMPMLSADQRVIVCPPFTALAHAADLIKGSSLSLGAQNMSEKDDGAYTGEISWRMLRSAGCEYVILGHSERRQYFLETDALINTKAKKALGADLVPILCVGETLGQREGGLAMDVISGQVEGVLTGLSASDMSRVVVAYEPVWAIGTGKNATPDQAQQVHSHIRGLIAQSYGEAVAEALAVLYGGSVKPDNVADLISQKDIDGSLVGGACLKADSFLSIIKSSIMKEK